MSDSVVKMGQRFARRGHELQILVHAVAGQRQFKSAEATLEKPAGRTFTIECDEGPYLEGDDNAPPPLSFLTSSIAF